MPANIPHREVYWNIPEHLYAYLVFAVVLVIFFYGFYQRYRLWRIGQPEGRFDKVGNRIKTVILNAFLHARMLRELYPGIMHLLILWGFLVMAVGAGIDFLHANLGLEIAQGPIYLYFLSLGVDMAGLVALIGIILAIIRRYVLRPSRLDNRMDDAVVLSGIFVMLVTGYVLEGIRINSTGDPWAIWSPIGYLTAMALGGPAPWQPPVHRILWWAHLALAMGLIGYLPFCKLSHVLISPLNQYFRSLEPKGALAALNLEDEEAESFGIGKLEDFSWKHLFDTGACTRCGRCQDNCPVFLSDKPLSPKKLIQDLKDHLEKKGAALLRAKVAASGKESGEEPERAIASRALIGDVVTEDEIWSCTTCRSCQEQCPVFVEQIPKVVGLRQNLVLSESRFPAEAQTAFRNMENNGNPWGIGWATRADWASEVRVKTMAEVDGEVEVLFWPGCAGAFDDRNRKVAKAMVKLMEAAGISFAVLGTEEKCCGDSARRLGNEYLFQMLAQENIETMKQYRFAEIVTTCPHCYNTIKNEYPQFGGEFNVVHHSAYLSRLLRDGRLSPRGGVTAKAVYHDSCYLGRYNEIYVEPRQVLKAAKGLSLVEADRHHGRSFCCGAGGGRMWLEEKLGKRINILRTEQVLLKNPDLIATACPFCLTMLSDGLKDKGIEEGVQVLDLSEILLKSFE